MLCYEELGRRTEEALHLLVVVVVDVKFVVRTKDPREPLLTELRVIVGGADAVAERLPAPRDLKITTILASRIVDLMVLVSGGEVEHLKDVGPLSVEARGKLRPFLVRVAARVEDREELIERRHFE
jgi:hypothetical protein